MNDEIKNAIIESAPITINDRGMLDVWLQLNFGGTGQGFGGWALYLPRSYKHHRVLSVAGHHLFRIMEIAQVEKWSDLPGKSIRVKGTFTGVRAIGHIIKDEWYFPESEFENAR